MWRNGSVMDFDSIGPSPILGTLAKSLRVGDKHWSSMMLSVNRVQIPTLPSLYEEQNRFYALTTNKVILYPLE